MYLLISQYVDSFPPEISICEISCSYQNRKPATAEWYYNSAHKVDEVDVVEVQEPWTGKLKISFNATIDRDGARQTAMKIILDENEIEYLYDKLIQGRKNKLQRLKKEVKKYKDQVKEYEDEEMELEDIIEQHVTTLHDKWEDTEAGSDKEAFWQKLIDPLQEILDIRQKKS